MDNWSEWLAPPTNDEWPIYRCSSEEDFKFPAEQYVDQVLSDSTPTSLPEFFCELENRKLEISNFDPGTLTRTVLREAAARFGDVEAVEIADGKAFVTFYDLRDACRMRRSSICVGGYNWLIQFAYLEKVVNRSCVPNNGTIVVFQLKKSVTDEAVPEFFKRFGGIKDLRSTPKKGTQRFIEFWDVRNCRDALVATNGKMVLGSVVRVEYGMPGGIRRNPEVFKENRLPTVIRTAKSASLEIRRGATVSH
jgi:hypothetical protein